jgi:hypothetical protein
LAVPTHSFLELKKIDLSDSKAFALTKASDSCPRGGDFVSGPHFIKIAKSVMKSRFCAISSDFCDFT